MARRPFDPGRAAGPLFRAVEPESPARRERRAGGHDDEASPLSVTELSKVIQSTLEERIASPLRVVGEMSNLSARGHWYFSLKDDTNVVSCVAWASAARDFGFTPRDGDEVVATGHVSHYGPQGRTQLYVRDLRPVGAGSLRERFEAMCRELRELGYFDPARKKPLPLVPRRIAIVTSKSGAAVHDVVDTARRRWPGVRLVLFDVRVQGDGAAQDVARTIARIDADRERLGVDAILVTRGGGSIEDLWAFNERVVADAAFACGLPLVAAIGHESDTTVVELVADVRAATPTQAAMHLVPEVTELYRQLDESGRRLEVLVRQRLRSGHDRLRGLSARPIFRRPEAIVAAVRERHDARTSAFRRAVRSHVAHARLRLERLAGRLAGLGPGSEVQARRARLAGLRSRLDRAMHVHRRACDRTEEWTRRLDGAMQRRVTAAAGRLDGAEARLHAVDPVRVLERGFTWTTDADGALVRSAEGVRAGDELVTHLPDGTVRSRVVGEGQMGLFGG